MDLWQLHIFCKVVELKSFSKAADAVRLSQPTVSSHIKDLEAHFDKKLVDRMPRQIVPTKAGLLLYDYARRLLTLKDKTETAMAEFGGLIKGRLLVGGSTIPSGYLLPKWIGQFTRQYPDVYVSLTVASTDEIIQKTISGHIELGIVGARTRDKALRQEAIVSDEMAVVVPASHAWAKREEVTISELLQAPFIARETGSGTLMSIQAMLQKSRHDIADLQVVAEMGSTEAVRQAIIAGVGISILSRIAVRDDVAFGLVKTIPLKDLDLKRNFYLTTHRKRSLSPLGIEFVQFLKQSEAFA